MTREAPLRFDAPESCEAAARAAAPLAAGEIRVHPFRLAAGSEARDAWAATLDAGERARASRFVRGEDRDRYVVAHGVLRGLLGAALGIAPRRVRLRTGVSGKPSLDRSPRAPALAFGLSHSDGCALVAISAAGEVGVDLERERDVEALAIARHHFAPEEADAIARAPAATRRACFFRHWVAKEAVLKGIGTGLTLPLDGFALRFDDALVRARVIARDPRLGAVSWNVRMLPAGDGWHAAIATQAEAPRIVVGYDEAAGSASVPN